MIIGLVLNNLYFGEIIKRLNTNRKKKKNFKKYNITSGAIQRYVPVSAVITPDWTFTRATPKSATLTTCKN